MEPPPPPQQTDLLKIGVLADLHLSTRQSLYRMVKAQVIPTIPPTPDTSPPPPPSSPPKPNADSPFIGPMAHEALQSTHQLLQAIGKGADMVVLIGDLYDHLLNLDPRECAGAIAKTSDLWRFTDFRKYYNEDKYERGDGDEKEDIQYYPPYLDALLGLTAIYQFYQDYEKPLFYINGNHEGYRNPFAMSPRLIGDLWRLNEVIPSDHNLTIYEAALLYGPHYDQWAESAFNFEVKNMELAHLLITPWQDLLLRQCSHEIV
jgi:hypothetical protein